jgi:nucleoside-diphosphate-sugar epimerase
MRCLVTGATGFIGSWLVRRLLADRHSVAILARSSSSTWRIASCLDSLTKIEGDLTCIGDSRPAIHAFAPDVVFHLAWTGGNSSKFANDVSQVYANVPGTLELLRIASETNATAFVNFGSCVEYGEYRIPVRESDPVLPKSLYGRAKYAVEELMQAIAPALDLRFVSLRLFWAYGPADDPARLVPSLISKLLKGERHPMTKGDQLWDYLYIEDVIEAIVSVMNTPSVEGIFNLGSGHAESLREVARKTSILAGNPSLLGIGDLPYGPGQVMHLEADITRLREATGWQPRVGLEEGLRATVAWYKENQ